MTTHIAPTHCSRVAEGDEFITDPDEWGDTDCGNCQRWLGLQQRVASQVVKAERTPTQPGTSVVTMSIVSGGTVQQVVDVLRVDHRRGRVLIVCHPDRTPRWVALRKPRTTS